MVSHRLGQIFARVTIEARNYGMQQGIIHGTPLTDSDLKTVWSNLNEDETYNIRSVAYLALCNAHQLGQPRPDLTGDLFDTRRLPARYNGTGEDADQYGRELIGLYFVLENCNQLSRSS